MLGRRVGCFEKNQLKINATLKYVELFKTKAN
jgi:hypothetical protein